MQPDPDSPESRNRYLLLRGEKIPLGRVIGNGDPYVKGIRPICPACGELWGKIEFGIPRKHESAEYLVARWPCEEHGNASFTGGSVWKLLVWWDRGIPPSLGAALPFFSPELARREAYLRAWQILGEIPPSNLLERETPASSNG